MFLDNGLSFNTNVSSAQSLTLSGSNADSTTVIDITGAGAGTAPKIINGFSQANTAIGADYGVGDGIASPYVVVIVTAVTTVTGTLTITLQAAPDNGSYSAGTYTTLFTSTGITGASMLYAPSVAGNLGGSVFYFPVPPILASMGEALPRFYKLNYAASGAITISVNSFMTINPASFALQKSIMLGGVYNGNFQAG